MNVLVVDDNKKDRILVIRALKDSHKNLAVIEAETGEQAVCIISEQQFDYILVNSSLGDIDGINLLKKIYDKTTELGPCPIIMMTGAGDKKILSDAFENGAQDFILKATVSKETLEIAFEKAKKVYDLKQENNTARQKLIHSQKMEAVGKLTGGIAHDFNNLLSIVFGNIRLLYLMLDKGNQDSDNFRQKVDAIDRSARRGAELVKQLMVFSRQRTFEPVSVNLNSIINESFGFIKSSLGTTIELKINLQDDLWLVDIDPDQFEHAIINFAVNARDAMPYGGHLEIKTENQKLNEKKYGFNEDLKPGDYVKISITDDGVGMDEEIQSKIFDPFFTTKDVGKGTGLGLSMVYGFIKDTGGIITLESKIGKGTSFYILIPKSENTGSEAEPKVELLEVIGGRETILLVEDEEEIRSLNTQMLESYGYHVLTAQDANRALEIIQSHKKLDLLFTDISMPGDMNGIHLVARALEIKKDLKVLFTSGYANENVVDFDLIKDNFPIINKPFQYSDLLEKIRNVLQVSEDDNDEALNQKK
ncbi:MAG: response regulator [Alphaproteobacteria bacterium]|nr:response regulator [Alphaproteobacteria bacterium]